MSDPNLNIRLTPEVLLPWIAERLEGLDFHKTAHTDLTLTFTITSAGSLLGPDVTEDDLASYRETIAKQSREIAELSHRLWMLEGDDHE